MAAATPATSAPQQEHQPGYEKYPLPHRPVHILDEQTWPLSVGYRSVYSHRAKATATSRTHVSERDFSENQFAIPRIHLSDKPLPVPGWGRKADNIEPTSGPEPLT
jgi:hypothetical protein